MDGSEKWLTARAVIGLFPAHALDNDSVELYFSEKDREILATLHFIRQQAQYAPGQPNLCLSDFIAPKTMDGQQATHNDYIGAFAVTAGLLNMRT